MIFSSASSNPAGTVLTVRGRSKSKPAHDWNQREERADFVVSGDGHKIAKSLKERSLTGWRFFFGMTFRAHDLPKPNREISIVSVDDEYAAQELTRAERDFFLNSGFDYAEIFAQIVARKTLAQKRTGNIKPDSVESALSLSEAPYSGKRVSQ